MKNADKNTHSHADETDDASTRPHTHTIPVRVILDSGGGGGLDDLLFWLNVN